MEKLSGIKAHTIRIWEQRYHIIDPKRTQTNIRYYTDDDLKCLLNIAFLNKNGIRISQIARMSREEIAQRVESISQESTENNNQLQSLTIAMVELDEQKVLQVINGCVGQWGFEQTVQVLFIPFLEKLSLLWLTGSISTVHEQFIHCILRQKILVALEQLPKSTTSAGSITVMLYLPKGENQDQEIILLLMQYLLRVHGFRVIYLGMGISLQDLMLAYQIHKTPYIYTILSENRTRPTLQEYTHKLVHTFPDVHFLVSGMLPDSALLVEYPALRLLENFDVAIDFLEELQRATATTFS